MQTMTMDEARQNLRVTFEGILEELVKRADEKEAALSKVEDSVEDLKGQIASKQRKLVQAEARLEQQRAVAAVMRKMIDDVRGAEAETAKLQAYIFRTLEEARHSTKKIDDEGYPTNSEEYKAASKRFGELMSMAHGATKESARLYYGKSKA